MGSKSLRKPLRANTASSASTVARSQNTGVSRNTEAPKPTGAANGDSASKTSTTQHKPAKRSRNRVPPPQRERILQAYAAGKSITDISKQEKRNRETVGKIVHGPEMAAHVQALRERWYGLGSDAIDAVENGLTNQKDGRLGFQVLASIGVLPSPAEIATQRQAMSPPEDDEAAKHRIAVGLMACSIERHHALGMPLLEQDWPAVEKVIKERNLKGYDHLIGKKTTNEDGEDKPK